MLQRADTVSTHELLDSVCTDELPDNVSAHKLPDTMSAHEEHKVSMHAVSMRTTHTHTRLVVAIGDASDGGNEQQEQGWAADEDVDEAGIIRQLASREALERLLLLRARMSISTVRHFRSLRAPAGSSSK